MADKHQWKTMTSRIRKMLLDEWDPIEIHDEPEAKSEYDRCVWGVYRLLMGGATDEEILDHLREIEMDQMGFSGFEAGRWNRTVKALRSIAPSPQ